MTQLNESQLFALIQAVRIEDPVLKDLLREFVKRQQIVFNELFEEVALPPEQANIPIVTVVADVQIFNYELVPRGIYFTWERPSENAILFELRFGDTWATASRQLVTSTLSATLPGRTAPGTHRFLIKAQALDGTQSQNATPLDVIIPAISIPILTSTVIDNFVLISWLPVDSAFQIDYYVITRDGEEIGRLYGTFISIFEVSSGTYNYGVTAVDIFGNRSEEAFKSISVSQPADYVLEALESDAFLGERINVYRDAKRPSIFAIINIQETWGEYAANGYDSLQDEIDAGYPYWLQPTMGNGEYHTKFDYGTVYNDLIVTIDWNTRFIAPRITVRCFISTSVDDITYSPEVETESMFVIALRYLKMRLVFTSDNADVSLIEIYNLRARLDVKLAMDAGQVYALALDEFGTPVFFNKPYKDIRSITVSVDSQLENTVTYSFVDEPDPRSFEVFVFDSVGARIDAPVSWKAQGVL